MYPLNIYQVIDDVDAPIDIFFPSQFERILIFLTKERFLPMLHFQNPSK